MQGRWWSPARGSIVLDDVCKSLLAPGEDAVLDLGASLLALHRAGAAACLEASQLPLVDEVVLVEKLAAAREHFAVPVCEAVGKSMGDPAYGGLLVADLANDAEHAALTLFRDAVAHGVPRQMAATRVGEVYGVPLRELGAYRKLATDPKASPPALSDAADRALFTAVQKVVDEEGVTGDVSKQEPWERERRRPRGKGGGEWVAEAEVETPAPETKEEGGAPPNLIERLRGVVGLPPNPGGVVAEEEREEVQAPVAPAAPERRGMSARERRHRRQKRQMRQVEQYEAAQSVQRSAPQAGVGQHGLTARGVGAQGLSARQIELTRLTPQTEAAMADPRYVAGHGEKPGMKDLPGGSSPEAYDTLGDRVGFMMTKYQSDKLLEIAEATGMGGIRMIKIGHVTDVSGGPAEIADGQAWGETQQTVVNNQKNRVDPETRLPVFSEPHQVVHIDAATVYSKGAEKALQDEQEEMLGDNYDEWGHVEQLGTPDGGMALVWKSMIDPENPDKRPLPTLVTWLVDDARGFISPSRQTTVELDPNQTYAIVRKDPLPMWDPKLGVMRVTYVLRPLDEEQVEGVRRRRGGDEGEVSMRLAYRHRRRGDGVGKADGDRPWQRERRIPRGQSDGGEWVAVDEVETQAPTTPVRSLEERLREVAGVEQPAPAASTSTRRSTRDRRLARQRREQRQREQHQQFSVPQRGLGEHGLRARSAARASERGLGERGRPEPPKPAPKPKTEPRYQQLQLREDGRYLVMPEETAQELLDMITASEKPLTAWPHKTVVTPTQIQNLIQATEKKAGVLDGYDADAALGAQANNLVTAESTYLGEVGHIDGPYPEAYLAAQHKIAHDASIGQIQIEPDTHEGDMFSLFAYEKPQSRMVVVELDDQMIYGDPDRPVVITFMGQIGSDLLGRHMREVPQRWEAGSESRLLNANTMIFKVNNVDVTMLRASEATDSD